MSSSPFGDRVHRLGPGVAAGMSLGISDVLGKIVLTGGVDVVSMLLFRSIVGLLFFATWFRVGDKPTATPAVRIVSLTVGIIFAGLIFCLFKAIETIDVPTAVLSYFTYPILTGLTAAVAGIERLRWKGMVCAVAAFQQPGLADRRASCRFHYHRRGLRGRSRVLAHRCSIDNARLSRRRRCPADYLVLHAVVHSDIYRNRIHRTDMEHATLCAELDLAGHPQFRYHGRNSVYISLDGAYRSVPHRGHHAS
jgi:hypothetical protein